MENGGNEDESLTIVNKALALLGKVLNPTTSGSVNSTPTSGDTEPTKLECEIELTKEKIEECSKFLKNLNPQENKLSHEQALLLIYFLETFALQGSGDEDVRTELKAHFSKYYYASGHKELDTVTTIGKIRERLLKHNLSKTLDLEDVAKCVKDGVSISDFFIELRKFVQHVKTGLDRGEPSETNCTLDKFLVNPKCELGKNIDEDDFLPKIFKKLLDQAFEKEKWTSTDLFDFVINFFPIFIEKSEWDCRKLRELRNRLLHQFHKYECVKFGNEIVGMRHELLRYHFAQKVYQIICDIKPGDEYEEINERLQEQIEEFVHNDPRMEKGFHGYKFSKSMLSEEVENFEELAEQYLKFRFLTHHFVERKYEEGDEVHSFEAPNFQQQRKKLTDSDKREWFEEFDRLERLRTDNLNDEYIKEKKRFMEISLTKYGVQKSNFEESYEYFEKNRSGFVQGYDTKDIARILNTLKDIRNENKKLANHVIVLLYDRFVVKKAVSNSLQDLEASQNVAGEQIPGEIKKKLQNVPTDRRIKLQINDKMLFVYVGDVIKGMLNIFCNAYDTYRVDFNIEDVFNDDTILDYLARNETEEVDVEKLVDPFFKFIVSFDPELCRLSEKARLLKKFLLLKRLPKKSMNKLYGEEKDKLKIELTKWGVEENEFNDVCQRYVEGNDQLSNDEKKKVQRVRGIISDLKGKGEDKHKKLTYKETSSLYERLIGGVKFVDCKNKKNLLDSKTGDEKRFIERALESFLKDESRDYELLRVVITNKFPECHGNAFECAKLLINQKGKNVLIELGKLFPSATESHLTELKDKLVELHDETHFEEFKLAVERWGKFVAGILKTFEGPIKLKDHNFMRVRKLLNIEYTAPYVVRLMTKAGNDNIIEKEDLKKLIGILLNEDYSYIKHLNNLLHIDSRKLNLYEEVCTHIIQPSFNIENMIVIFNEPKHVNGILTALGKGIDQKGESTMNILRLLNGVVLELILSHEVDTASDILNDNLEKTFSRFKTGNEREREIWVGYQLNLVELKNTQGERDESNSKYEEAMEILTKLLDPNSTRYLEILFYKAYTHKVLGEFGNSHQTYEKLYKEIVLRVLKRYDSDACHTNEIYKKIEDHPDYHKLRGLSEVSQRYLDILDIVRNIAYTLFKQHQGNEKWLNTLTVYSNFADSIKIIEALYKYTEDKFKEDREHRNTVLMMRQLSLAYSQICKLKIQHLKSNPVGVSEYETMLQHLRAALEKDTKVLEIQRTKNDNKFYIFIEKGKSHYILMDIYNLAYIYNMLGTEEQNGSKKVSHYEKALNIYLSIRAFEKQSMSWSTEAELNISNHIAFTYNKLGSALPKKHPKKVLHCQEVLKTNLRIRDLKKENGLWTPEAKLETSNHIASAHIKLGSALPETDPEKVSHYQKALNIYKEIYDFSDPRGQSGLRALKNIALTLKYIGYSEFQSEDKGVSTFERALEKYKEARKLTENIHTSESEEYLKACINVASIHSRLYYLIDLKESDHYEKLKELCTHIENSLLADPADKSRIRKWIASAENTYHRR